MINGDLQQFHKDYIRNIGFKDFEVWVIKNPELFSVMLLKVYDYNISKKKLVFDISWYGGKFAPGFIQTLQNR